MKTLEKTMTGSDVLTDLIGTLETDIITTIYGPGGTGKTLLCMLAAVEKAKEGKVLYIDTEGGFSIERFKQVTGDQFETLLGNITFLKPTSFEEQKKIFSTLKQNLSKEITLVVVDTIAMLYRLELGKNEEIFDTNRELGRQLSELTEIARKNNIPVLVTNQVYHNVDNGKVRMVGGDMLLYGSKCLIELTRNGKRKAILRKHRSKKEKEISFQIVPLGCKIVQ